METFLTGPMRVVDEERMANRRHLALKIPQSHSGEEIERRVVRVAIARMGEEDPGRPELPQNGLQIRENLLALEGAPGRNAVS